MQQNQIIGEPNLDNSNSTMYATRLYNEAKYLDSPLPCRSLMSHINKHLPWNIQITLMVRENFVEEVIEFEKILNIFQNIKDWELDSKQMQIWGQQMQTNAVCQNTIDPGQTPRSSRRDNNYVSEGRKSRQVARNQVEV